MTTLYSIILAGGSGSRLWPMSREMFPKQMFKLDDDYTLFQKTFLNLSNFVDDKNIVTATNIKYVSQIKEQLKILQEKFCRRYQYKVVSEPLFKNTAASILLSTKYIMDELYLAGEEPVVLVVPSDHMINDRNDFSNVLEKGITLAKAGYIVSYGTETEVIDENFGYIKARKNKKIFDLCPDALKVSTFIEKPTTKESKEKLKGKKYVNSGVYMFTPSTLFKEFEKYMPEMYEIIKNKKIVSSIPSIGMSDYELMKDSSIDYALMEKSNNVVICPLSPIWKDIGSWDSYFEISKKDENGNYFSGKTIDVDSKNTMVYSTSKLAATLGLENTIVVATEDAILVCDKNNTNGVKNIYKKLNGKNASTREIHKTVYRPWGYYTVLENGNGFLTKCITVNPNAKLSVQLHHHRSEHWIILEGEATILKGSETVKLHSGESIDIAVEEIHSLQNYGQEQLKVLEIQQGDILDENDIERLEDMYGRA